MRAMSFSLCVAGASAHGMMTYPPTRFPNAGPGYPGLFPNGSVLWFNQGCSIGCKAPSGDTCSKFKPNGYSSACCEEPMEPTLNSDGAGGPNSPSLSPRTYNDAEEAGVGHLDITKYNPWRAPGHAPVADPCGIAGGWGTPGAPGNGGVPPPGFKQGDRGSALPPVKTPTVWKAGGVATVAWGVVANHGGGYQYRLCKRGQNITEECFQQMPLEPTTKTHEIAYGALRIPIEGKPDPINTNTTTIPAVHVNTGTKPAGSTWIRNPIPACYGPGGGAEMTDCDGPQFPPPIPGLFGFGPGRCTSGLPYNAFGQHKFYNCSTTEYLYWLDLFNFNVVDKLKVPDVKGDYVLSFRWDCEQTPQIWAGCSDVRIE